MATSTARVRVLNEQSGIRRLPAITASGALTIPAKYPVVMLAAGSAYNITDIVVPNGAKDGMTVEIMVSTGSSALTLVETGNISVAGSSLALGALDSAKLRYVKLDDKWYQIGATNL